MNNEGLLVTVMRPSIHCLDPPIFLSETITRDQGVYSLE